MNPYYTYLHRKQSDNSVFYIGKGRGNRAHSRSGRSSKWKRCAEKHGIVVEVLAGWPTEREALDHECFLIKCFREMGADLCNHTDGGEGVSGLKHSEASKRRMAQAKLGKPQSAESIAIRVSKLRGQKRSADIRAKLSSVQQDPLRRAKLSAALKAHARSEEHEMNLQQAYKSHERRSKISAALRGKAKSPEHVAKTLKPVICLNTGDRFDSLKSAVQWMQASGAEGVKSHQISMVLTGKRKTVHGFRWAYA